MLLAMDWAMLHRLLRTTAERRLKRDAWRRSGGTGQHLCCRRDQYSGLFCRRDQQSAEKAFLDRFDNKLGCWLVLLPLQAERNLQNVHMQKSELIGRIDYEKR